MSEVGRSRIDRRDKEEDSLFSREARRRLAGAAVAGAFIAALGAGREGQASAGDIPAGSQSDPSASVRAAYDQRVSQLPPGAEVYQSFEGYTDNGVIECSSGIDSFKKVRANVNDEDPRRVTVTVTRREQGYSRDIAELKGKKFYLNTLCSDLTDMNQILQLRKPAPDSAGRNIINTQMFRGRQAQRPLPPLPESRIEDPTSPIAGNQPAKTHSTTMTLVTSEKMTSRRIRQGITVGGISTRRLLDPAFYYGNSLNPGGIDAILFGKVTSKKPVTFEAGYDIAPISGRSWEIFAAQAARSAARSRSR